MAEDGTGATRPGTAVAKHIATAMPATGATMGTEDIVGTGGMATAAMAVIPAIMDTAIPDIMGTVGITITATTTMHGSQLARASLA